MGLLSIGTVTTDAETVLLLAIAVVAVKTEASQSRLHSLSRSGKSTLMPDCYEIRNAITVISGELDRSMAMVGGPGCKCLRRRNV